MICKRCGSVIEEGSLFCGECGWDVRKPYNPEPPVDPGVNIPIESIDEDDPYSIAPNIDYYPEPDSNSKKPKGKTIALIVLLAVIVLFAVISILSVTDFVSFQNIPVLSQYESFLQELTDKKDEKNMPEEKPVNGEESISNPVSEDNAGQKEPYSIWSPSESEQSLKKESNDKTSQSKDSDIPDELSAYKDKLVVENRNYEITLERSNYNILFRSSPELIDVDSSDSNVISRIPDGTRIYVSYIYNGTWAVHFYNGKWGFSSLYHKNDPSSTKLMKPVD